MKVVKTIVIAALLGAVFVDNQQQVQAVKLQEGINMMDFNGADEDEIMDKVFSKYSTEGKDHNGIRNGIKILMKSTAPKACGVILEATHKLKGTQVPGYIKANFDKVWENFDINSDGFIKAEETHTFMRSLMGKLNKFALAPGSLSDIGGGPAQVAASEPQNLAEETPAAPKAKKSAKKSPAKKKAEDEAAVAQAQVENSVDPENAEAELLAQAAGNDVSVEELQQAAGQMLG